MTFKFRIVSDEVDDFKREIEIDADDTFLDFRDALCEAVGFDRGEISSFHICDRNWEREKEVTLEDMGADSSLPVFIMEDTPLSDLLDDEGQRLTWVFDYLTDRSLFIELKSVDPSKHVDHPVCLVSKGQAPAQSVDMDDFDAKIDANAAKAAGAADLDDDFYGSEDYNDDEINLDEMSLDDTF